MWDRVARQELEAITISAPKQRGSQLAPSTFLSIFSHNLDIEKEPNLSLWQTEVLNMLLILKTIVTRYEVKTFLNLLVLGYLLAL